MVTNTNLKYVESSSKLLCHHDARKLKKIQKFKKSQLFSQSRSTKCRVKANNLREASVISARYIVKRPSKRSALVATK